MTVESEANFEEKLTLGFKSDMRHLVNFNARSSKSENVYVDGLHLTKVYLVWAKKLQRIYV